MKTSDKKLKLIGLKTNQVRNHLSLIIDSSGLEKTNITLGRLLALALITFTVFMIVSCDTSAEKVKSAEIDLIKSEQALDKANAEYQADVKNFRIATSERVERNNQSINELKKKIEGNKKEVKSEYKKQIDDLEKKNSEMNVRLSEYKADKKEDWQTFKDDFSKDMDDLGMALKNFTTDKN